MLILLHVPYQINSVVLLRAEFILKLAYLYAQEIMLTVSHKISKAL